MKIDKSVISFNEFNSHNDMSVGIQGVNIFQMVKLGLSVPEGFVITSTACDEYLNRLSEHQNADEFLSIVMDRCKSAIQEVEMVTERNFGSSTRINSRDSPSESPSFPLLFSIWSGLHPPDDFLTNVGLNDEIVDIISLSTGNKIFAYKIYAKFLRSFGIQVLKKDSSLYYAVVASVVCGKDYHDENEMTLTDLKNVIEKYKDIARVPPDPYDQFQLVVKSLLISCQNHNNSIEHKTAILCQRMVYGDLNSNSCSGFCFTRHPSTGESDFSGQFLWKSNSENKNN